MIHHSQRLATWAAVALAISVMMSALLTLTSAPAGATTSTTTASTYAGDAFKSTNAYRSQKKLPTTSSSSCLASYANSWAKHIATKGKLEHQSTNALKAILKKCKLGIIGENLAYGQKTGADVVAAWRGSTGHRKNLETKRFTQQAVGAYWDGKRWWTAQLLAGK